MYIKVDISIVTFNSEKWLKNFFESLLKQSYPCKLLNIYITDNSSTDNTYNTLRYFEKLYAEKFCNIRIVRKPNNGFGAGHNNNLRNSSSDFFLVTNVDLEFEKDAIINAVNFAINDDNNVASWEFRQKPYEHPKKYNPINLITNWSSSACILFRKKALLEIGGYDEKIFMYGEDVDLSYRLRDNGYILRYFPQSSVWHYTYEFDNQVKPIQFFGSTKANVLLRVRFGKISEIILGYIYFLGLFFLPEQFSGQRIGILRNLFSLLKLTPFFTATRKHSNLNFDFIGWDYEKQRRGAFYKYPKEIKLNVLVSVIIRTYGDRIELLKCALKSLMNQTYTKIEIIVVEDGSERVKEYLNNLKLKTNLNIKYYAIPKSGRCIAGNKGLEEATGQYCIFLDDDDVFYPDHIEVLISGIAQSGLKVAYTNAFEVKTEIMSLQPLSYLEYNCDVMYKQNFSRISMWHHNYIPILCVLFQRSLFLEYGGFDETLDNLEDWNLWTRYSLHNDFFYIDKTTAMYRVPAKINDSAERQEKLNKYYEMAKEKQKYLVINNISVKEISDMALELNKEMNIIAVPMSSVRKFVDKHAGLYGPYILAKKVYHKFKSS